MCCSGLSFYGISIHSLRMEGDISDFTTDFLSVAFQSTPSAWRETDMQWYLVRIHRHFNPLPPHGGRHVDINYTDGSDQFQSTPSAWRETNTFAERSEMQKISIHSLRMEGDHCQLYRILDICIFQSTPSAWRETRWGYRKNKNVIFQSTPSAWRETRSWRYQY